MKEKEYEDAFITKELTIHSDDRGFLMEILRMDDPIYKKFVSVENMVGKFEKDLYEKGHYIKWNDTQHIKQLNTSTYNLEPDKIKIDFDIYDLAKIYDINNKDFKNRKPIFILTKKISINWYEQYIRHCVSRWCS